MPGENLGQQVEDSISTLANFLAVKPDELYALLIYNHGKHLTEVLKKIIKDNANDDSLKEALIDFMEMVDEEKSAILLQKLIAHQFGQKDYTFMRFLGVNPESLKIILKSIPKHKRLAAVKAKDEYDRTVLHEAVGNPESLQVIRNSLPGLIALQFSQKNYTLLSIFAAKPKSLKIMLKLIPKPERLEAVKAKDEYGRTVLLKSSFNPQSVQEIINSLPEDERLEAIKVRDKYEYTVLHHAFINLESLQVITHSLPEDERLEAIKVQDKYGKTVLHQASDIPESLNVILESLPINERLEAVKVQDKYGKTVLHQASHIPESLKVIINSLPEYERLEAVKVQDQDGNTVSVSQADILALLKPISSIAELNQPKRASEQLNTTSVSVLTDVGLFAQSTVTRNTDENAHKGSITRPCSRLIQMDTEMRDTVYQNH